MTEVQKLAKIMVLKDLYKEYELLAKYNGGIDYDRYCALEMAVKALEQEPREDEVILTRKEYGELVSSEYDHGYEKGYMEALEQEPILDKVRAEIDECGSIWVAYAITGRSDRDIENLIKGVLKQAKEQVLNIIDKYKAESEGKE